MWQAECPKNDLNHRSQLGKKRPSPRAPLSMADASVAFRFPSEASFEQAGGVTRVGELRALILERRPAAREALHGAAGLAAAGWKLLLTDAASKTGACRGCVLRAVVGTRLRVLVCSRLHAHAKRVCVVSQSTRTTPWSCPRARSCW